MKNRCPLPWIEALLSWSKCHFRQEEVCFLEYVRSSHVMLIFRCSWDAPSHSPRYSGRAHQRTHQLARLRVRSSMMRLMVVASWLKSRQKVKKSSKSPKSLKGQKNFQGLLVSRIVYRSTDSPSKKALTVFRALFAWPRSSLDTTFEAIIVKAKLMELLRLCHVFFLEEPGLFKLLCTEFLSAKRTYSLKRCAPEEDVQTRISLMAGRMSRELCMTKACLTFLRSSKLS